MAGPQCTSCFPFPFLTDCGNGKHGKHPPFAPSYPILSLKLLDQRPIDQPDHSEEWTSWLAEGTLDVAVPMAYTTDTEEFHGWVDAALAAAGDPDRVWAGVGAYRNPVDRTVEQIDEARAIGVSGIVVFSYNKPSETPPPDGTAAELHRIGLAAFR